MQGLSAIGFLGIVALCGLSAPADSQERGGQKVPGVLSFKMTSIDGKEVDLAKYRGKVVLIVNVASECGYTPQYQGLQALHEKHAKEGLAVLGFPCNDFGMQEPGTNAQVAEFCKKNYGVQFDLFAKITIEGKQASGLYKHLTSKETNPRFSGPVRWNFEKFLIGRNGEVVARFASDVEPDAEEFLKVIRAELAKQP